MYVTYYTVPKELSLEADILKAALSGYGVMLKEITRRMAALEREIKAYQNSHRLAYLMSPEAKERIRLAQKERWRKYRAEQRAKSQNHV